MDSLRLDTPVCLYKGILVRFASIISYCIQVIYEFQKEFPSWNFLVPTEELIDP